MVRTIISLDPQEKSWLERRAREEGVSMAELVRRAVRKLRDEGPARPPDLDELLEETAGLGTGEDGLVTQKRLRSEW